MRVLTCVIGATLAMSALADDLDACAGISSDAARLECYDQLAGRETRQDSAAPAATAAPPPPAAAAASEEPAEPVPEMPAEPVPEKLFGKPPEEAQAAYAEAAGLEEINEIRGTVKSVTMDGRGRAMIVLDNGQRWRQVRNEYFKVKAGDEVIVRKAVLGSYSLQKMSGGRWTKVRRID